MGDKDNIPQSVIIAHALGLLSSFPETPKHDSSLAGWTKDIKLIARKKRK